MTRILLHLLLAATVWNVTVPALASLAAAVLPSSRSTEIGNTVTVFSTIINAGTDTVTDCSINSPSALALDFGYQTTDPATNLPTGLANTPVTIAAGQSQSFVLTLTPTAPLDAVEVPFDFSCLSGATAESIEGINTLLLSASNSPVADVIALAATSQNTGVLSHDNSAGAFALATINIGAADTVTVRPDTGGQSLPVQLSVCQTNAVTGECLQTPAPTVDVTMLTGATPTFSVFSQASAAVANDAAINRVFVRFTDSGDVVRGGTSVAIANELLAGAPRLSESALTVLSRVFELLFGGPQVTTNGPAPAGVAPSVAQPIEQIISCETGQVVVSGTVDSDQNSSTSDVEMDFQNCESINGTLSVVSTVSIDGLAVALDVIQNGTYSAEGCEEINLTNVRVSGEFDLTTPVNDLLAADLFSTSGIISGRCDGISFSCSLQDVDLQNEEELINSCSA